MLKDIVLISETFKKDDFGNDIPQRTEKELVAEFRSIKQSEFFKANHEGMRPEMVAEIFYLDYNGEREAVIDGNRFKIYRAYSPPETEICELYLERMCRSGEKHTGY